jgi:hypothetical protein
LDVMNTGYCEDLLGKSAYSDKGDQDSELIVISVPGLM